MAHNGPTLPERHGGGRHGDAGGEEVGDGDAGDHKQDLRLQELSIHADDAGVSS